jgi:hypothetical protein
MLRGLLQRLAKAKRGGRSSRSFACLCGRVPRALWPHTARQLIERRMIRIPSDEKLVAQLTSTRKLYDSRGREKLESKADLASRGAESLDRADAPIGAVMMGPGFDPYVL